MNTLTAEMPSQAIRERVKMLGLPVLNLRADGRVVRDRSLSTFERMLVESALFTNLVRRSWAELEASKAKPCELAPGVCLVPIGRSAPDAERVSAVLLLSEAILQSDWLRAICDQSQRDFAATVASIDRGRLMSAGEAQRLGQTLAWMDDDCHARGQQQHEIGLVSEQLSNTYEELSLLYSLSGSMTVNQSPTDFLMTACNELQQVVGLSWVALCLAEDEPRLEDMAGQIFMAGTRIGDRAAVRRLGFNLLSTIDSSGPQIIDDTRAMLPQAADISRDLLVVPVPFENGYIGVMYGGERLDHEPMTSIDAKLCASLCNNLSIFLENMMLFEDAQAMFLGTLHALTSAIDAKDSYTFGHSERVALLSRMLAEKHGLDAEQCERVYLAGLVHDVGKIGVPEAVLTKAGRLTDEEFQQIKRHPAIGANILKDIRRMNDLVPGVLYHHERWDGNGYPSGLAGKEIPLFGRLIGVADAFDAMSSNRTYRKALPLEHVLDEFRRCRGSQFDPELTDLFLELDFGPFFDLIQKHQQQAEKGRSLGGGI